LTGTDGIRNYPTSTRVSQIRSESSSSSGPCSDTTVGLVSSIALRRNSLKESGCNYEWSFTTAFQAGEPASFLFLPAVTNTVELVGDAGDSEDGAGTDEERE
jgi:hypothetical protein